MPKRNRDRLPLFEHALERGGPVADLMHTECLPCGASRYEVEHQTGDLCPACDRNRGQTGATA